MTTPRAPRLRCACGSMLLLLASPPEQWADAEAQWRRWHSDQRGQHEATPEFGQPQTRKRSKSKTCRVEVM